MTHNTRSKKRSRSGADQPCPHCGKKLRGEKGMKMHMQVEHGDYGDVVFPRTDKQEKYKKVGAA